jgi:Transposase DDE domain
MEDQSNSSPHRKAEQPPDGIYKLKLVARAKGLFGRLCKAGTERDKAGNRRLLYSNYAALVLLSMFNPAMQTLRGLQQMSALKRVQKRLGIGRVSLGSFSESCRVFDPELLVPLIQELLAELPRGRSGSGPHRHIPDTIPRELAKRLVAVDGSVLRALPQIVKAASEHGGAWKIHLQFRPLSGLPVSAKLGREYEDDEREVLGANLEAGYVYIADRGYEKRALFNQIVRAKSQYVIRGQLRPVEIVTTNNLTDADRSARVISDEIVTFPPSQKAPPVDHSVRRIIIAKRDQGRVRSDRPNAEQVILYTNMLIAPAWVIAAIYELRWTIELFFRFLKQMLGLRRLFSDKAEAVSIQVYCALIACLLLAQITGGRVTMDAFRLISFYLQGWADEEELIDGLNRIRQREENKHRPRKKEP